MKGGRRRVGGAARVGLNVLLMGRGRGPLAGITLRLTVPCDGARRCTLLPVSPVYSALGRGALVLDREGLLGGEDAVLSGRRALVRGVVGVLVPGQALGMRDRTHAVALGDGLLDEHLEVRCRRLALGAGKKEQDGQPKRHTIIGALALTAS